MDYTTLVLIFAGPYVGLLLLLRLLAPKKFPGWLVVIQGIALPGINMVLPLLLLVSNRRVIGKAAGELAQRARGVFR